VNIDIWIEFTKGKLHRYRQNVVPQLLRLCWMQQTTFPTLKRLMPAYNLQERSTNNYVTVSKMLSNFQKVALNNFNIPLNGIIMEIVVRIVQCCGAMSIGKTMNYTGR
jgi:hypothetical protein